MLVTWVSVELGEWKDLHGEKRGKGEETAKQKEDCTKGKKACTGSYLCIYIKSTHVWAYV